MRVSVGNEPLSKMFGDEKAFELLGQIGFEAIDVRIHTGWMGDMREDYVSQCGKLKQIAKANNIVAGQLHAPDPSYVNGDSEKTQKMFEAIVRSIDAARILEAPYVVVHPPIPVEYKYNDYKAETKEISMDFYGRLLPYAKESGVKIAIENMWNYDKMRKRICPTVCSTAEEMADYVDTLGQEWFCACLDLGHSLLTYERPEDAIRLLGERLKVVHIHDVDGIDDLHTIPYLGACNWDACCQAFADIGYTGDINFETAGFLKRFPQELTVAAHQFALVVAKHLRDKILAISEKNNY